MIFALYLSCISVIYCVLCFDVFWIRALFTFTAVIFYVISEKRYTKLKDRIEDLEKKAEEKK